MNKFTIIGLAGRARTGKDTAANIICSELHLERDSFAGPFRNMTAELFGYKSVTEMEPDKEAINNLVGFSPRLLMQLFGSEVGRAIDKNLWTNSARLRTIKKCMEQNNGVVFTDVRFENEADFIRHDGGEIWHIERDDAPQVNDHTSEDGIKKQPEDITIDNNGTLADLREQINGIIYATPIK